ncbi:DeoR/GlpR transcriptional regulator [bacterium]|nr:DeoR/GlpR transcriptional regulator [bacterium]
MNRTILKEKRKEKIIEFIKKSGTVSIEDLARELGLSTVTIRKDVKELEKAGLVDRLWGGVSIRESSFMEPSFAQKHILNIPEKKAIARTAISLLNPNDIIGISAGTTAYEFARLLYQFPNIHVVTYGLNIAYLLARIGINVVVPGGFLREKSFALVGEETVAFLKRIHLDKCFMGVDGIDEEVLTDVNMAEAAVNRIMIERSKELIVIADHTKLGQRKLTPIAQIEKVNVLITDSKADKRLLKAFEDKGVKILIGEVKEEEL